MKKETAYQQCQNCHNKRFRLFGSIYCKTFGRQSVKELKGFDHCAGQSIINWNLYNKQIDGYY